MINVNGVVQAAVFCLLVSVNVVADSLTEFNAEFDISVAGLPAGKSVYSLAKQADGNYQIQTISSARGVFKLFLSDEYILTSQFSLKEGAVQPQWFLDEKTGEDERLKLSFDWQNQLLEAENDKGIKQVPIQANTQDVLSYHVLLPNKLKQGLSDFSFPVAEEKKLKQYHIKVLGHEVLKTKLGQLNSIKLTRLQDDDRKSYVWLAPELNYIPIQAVHIENGFTIKAQLNALSGLEIKQALLNN
jgi:hypothetical protein